MSRNITQAALSVLSRVLNPRLLVVQGLVGIFLCVNFLMIFTFFMKEVFRSNLRYILFAHTLFCDTLFLLIVDALFIVSFSRTPMPAGVCMVVYGFVSLLNLATPLTLTAMCVERYVAICMPLRHAEIATPRRATGCIFVIHALSSVMQIAIFSMVVSSATVGFYAAPMHCSIGQLVTLRWQRDLRSALSQLYFLLMSVTIAFTYFRIMAAARAASADDRKSSAKGLRTVLLHAFQLLLCLIMLWLPLIETAVREVDVTVFLQLRYFDYIAFILAPRCLSPLVYGLRDEHFFQVLKSYTLLRCYKTFPPTKIFSISEKS